jgi:hypothetical protein
MDRECSTHGRGVHARKEPLGKPGWRWEDDITTNLTEIEWGYGQD